VRDSASIRRVQDEQLKPLLDMYRRAGRKVFLATNSLWDYTNVVMNFIVDAKVGSDRSTSWLQARPL
jgi:5'-nucleotidase